MAEIPRRLRGPRRCNCLVWAYLHKRRLEKEGRFGGYIAKRRSRNLPWLLNHRLWSRDLIHWYAYEPIRDPAAKGWQRLKDLCADGFGLWFRGHVVEEDPAHSPEHKPHHHHRGT